MRAFTSKDGRDLLWLLFILIVMTNLLRAGLSLLVKIDLSVSDAWLISALVLLIVRLVMNRVRRDARAREHQKSNAMEEAS